MPLLEFRFVLSSRDVLTGMRVMQARSLGFRTAMVAVGVCAVLTWAVAVMTHEQAVHNLALVFTVLGAFLIVYQLFVVPWTLTGELGLNDHVRSESTWRVGWDGIAIGSAHKQTFLPWSSFARVLETPDHYLLIYVSDRHQFQIVPRRALQTDQARMLEDLIARHLRGQLEPHILAS